jgi:5-methyltetrahydrofolate--homocysteine methyltransferase
MSDLLNDFKARVLLCDGGMGALVQAMNLSVDEDFQGKENCTEILNLSRPDVIRDIHQQYYAAGSDCVTTNTFGGSTITLAEFDLQDQTFEINKRAVELAREAADSFGDGKRRYILGDVGPGTKLPSLGHIDYDSLEAGIQEQCRGLLAGGIDAFLIETCQDPLQIKAAVNAAKAQMAIDGVQVPIFVQVTVETTGTLLVGTDIAAAGAIMDSLGVDALGLNCATGPQEMAEHVRWLSENWRGQIFVQPNAGLPELVDGKTHYPLGAKELADWHERFIKEDGVNLVGGCCGTTPEHIAAIHAMLIKNGANGGERPAPVPRHVQYVPSVASLYSAVSLRQENAFLSIGERCNANGSKKFRMLQDNEDWDGIVAMAREQVKEGSNTLDVCTAFVGRNEIRDMTEVVSRLRGAVTTPLVIDSTETPVIEAALKLYGGKSIINSINFEDGEELAEERVKLARKFGASVIALTIDEDGMAKTVDEKIRIAKRLYDFAVVKHGLPAHDLMFDPLTFTICTGNEDDRKLGLYTLDAIARIRAELPDCQIILGLSNISFGLKAVARHVLNSVFLDHAIKRGMTGAIVHVSKIKPLHQIPAEEVKAAEDLIFDRRAEGYDPLQAFIALYQDRNAQTEKEKKRPETIEERLKCRIIDGDRLGMDDDLAEAMQSYPPLEIINTLLLDGMKVVGELFGAGKMQLPFVLQSAETMKAAVAYLEPHMEKTEGQEKGVIVLATVKGDVHDIGKNLVDIILTNNGYKVYNIGIKQPVAAIIEKAKEVQADAVGMSGLLVKSTVIMKDNLEEMARQNLDMPVFLGGAALTRAFVEEDCVQAYGSHGRVAYARDAFDGLDLMAKVVDGHFDAHLQTLQEKRANRPSRKNKAANANAVQAPDGAEAHKIVDRPVDFEAIKLRKTELMKNTTVPTPPFWGSRVVENVALKALIPYINETMLFQFQWGFKKQGRKREEHAAWLKEHVKPEMVKLLQRCEDEKILTPKAVYGYWKAAAEGDAILLFDESGEKELTRFHFPRQNLENGLCLSDFVRDVDSGERDVIGLQAVTMGQRVSDVARDWFEKDLYKDYLFLHGISVETAEALAEFIHKRIRAELGYADEDGRTMAELLKQNYRGSRYSFGYPACPNLEDQEQLLALLGADRIGMTLTENYELDPEQSTSAIVLMHAQAKYFKI